MSTAVNTVREVLRRSGDERIAGMTLQAYLVSDTAHVLYRSRSAAMLGASFEDYIADELVSRAIAERAERRLQAARKDAATKDLVALAVVEERDFARRIGASRQELDELISEHVSTAFEAIASAVQTAIATRAATLPTELDIAAQVSDQLEWQRAGHRIVVRDGVEILEPLPLPSFTATFERDPATRLTRALHVVVEDGPRYKGTVQRDAFQAVERVTFAPEAA